MTPEQRDYIIRAIAQQQIAGHVGQATEIRVALALADACKALVTELAAQEQSGETEAEHA